MRRLVLLALLALLGALTLGIASNVHGATAARWHKAGQVSDANAYYASALMTTTTKRAQKVLLLYAGNAASTKFEVLVTCYRSPDFETRNLVFYSPRKSGRRYLNLPLKKARCVWVISGTREEGGAIVFSLWALR